MLTTLDAAKGMQRKHTKLMRDIDRVRSILPPDFVATAFTPDAQISPAGKRQRFFHLTRDACLYFFIDTFNSHIVQFIFRNDEHGQQKQQSGNYGYQP